MEKKGRLEEMLFDAGKTAKNLLDNAIQAADQNDDGKFDFSDVSVIAGAMGEAVKKARKP